MGHGSVDHPCLSLRPTPLVTTVLAMLQLGYALSLVRSPQVSLLFGHVLRSLEDVDSTEPPTVKYVTSPSLRIVVNQSPAVFSFAQHFQLRKRARLFELGRGTLRPSKNCSPQPPAFIYGRLLRLRWVLWSGHLIVHDQGG